MPTPGRAVRSDRHHADPLGLRMLSVAGRGDPLGVPGVRTGVEVQDRPVGESSGGGPDELLQGRRPEPGGRPSGKTPAARSVPAGRGGHQFQAADPQDAGVFPRGSPELRGGGNAQPAGVRPGVLREERRRGRGPETDRTPLQDPGVRARGRPWPSGGDPDRQAHDRHVQPGAGAGRVLLRSPVRQDGRGVIRTESRDAGGTRGGGNRPDGGPGRAGVSGYPDQAEDDAPASHEAGPDGTIPEIEP